MTQVSDGSSSYKASKGQFETAGDIVIDDGLTLNVVAKDRLYYDIASGNYGTRGYGTNGKGSNAYADGYTADGMFYSNGSGGENRRCVVLNNVTAGDGISVYTGPSNAANSGVEFKYLGTEGEQNDEHIVAGGTQEKDHGITGDLSGGTGITDTGDTHDDGTEDQREDHHIQCIHIDASQKTGDGQYRFKSSSQKKSGQNTENQADKDCTCDMFLIPCIKLFHRFPPLKKI